MIQCGIRTDPPPTSHTDTENTTMASKIAVADKPKVEEKYHDPDDPSYDPRLDPDVGPYDEDNDFFPELVLEKHLARISLDHLSRGLSIFSTSSWATWLLIRKLANAHSST